LKLLIIFRLIEDWKGYSGLTRSAKIIWIILF